MIVEGNYDTAEEFAEMASKLRSANGGALNLDRFFSESNELFHFGGTTFALSNQWSKKYLPDLEKLVAKYPQAGISFARSSQEDL